MLDLHTNFFFQVCRPGADESDANSDLQTRRKKSLLMKFADFYVVFGGFKRSEIYNKQWPIFNK